SMVNVTVPVGVPAEPVEETIAVKVIGSPTVAGLNDDASEVVVGVGFVCGGSGFTVCVGSEPRLGPTFESPLYDAVTECCPAVSDKTNCAWVTPPRTDSGSGVCASPSMVNVMVPVGVPATPAALTTAVKVTGSPSVDGLADDETVVTVAGNPSVPATFENS